MIELNDIYKLKHIKGLDSNNDYEYKVLAINKEKTMVHFEQINGYGAGERFVFMIKCLLGPEKPNDKYFGEIIIKD